MLRFLGQFQADFQLKSGWIEPLLVGGYAPFSPFSNSLKNNPNITRKILAHTVGISPSAVQKHINRLKAAGVIIRHGGDRGGYWEIVD